DALIDHYRADIFCEIDFLDSVDRAGERNFLREKLLDAAEDAAKAEAAHASVETAALAEAALAYPITTKITARCARKLPLPGVSYSNQESACEATIGVGGQLSPQAIQEKTLELFAYLSTAVDAQFNGAGSGRRGTSGRNRPVSRPAAGFGRGDCVWAPS
ncbi:MAG: hypothetical protein NTW87_05715, partial [Planctomycetota bacterium]|nr:hypothetical protein [Planctomycetota bacterium]